MLRALILFFLMFGLDRSVSAAAEGTAFPAITVGNPSAETKIEFFLSPTCPMCAATFRNIVIPLINKASNEKDIFVFIGILPRSEEDVKFARVLACVPQAQLLPFMTDWYFYRRAGTANFKQLLKMGHKYNITGNDEAECTNARNDQALFDFNQLIFNQHKLKETPVIFLNRKHLPETYYLWQIEQQLPKLIGNK